MQPLTQLADAARAVIAAFDRAGELTDELISALELALNGAELSPATEQSGEELAWLVVNIDDQDEQYVPASDKRRIEHFRASPGAWEMTPLYTRQQPAPAVLDGWQSGVEACAKMLEKKAEDYASEFGHSDMGALSFGSGFHADVKRDHHSTLLELAEELRALLAAAPQPAQQLPSVIEEIALQWDGCEYESSTGQIDIGWAIRAAGQRLLAAPQPREGAA
ncbi:hypothetical protein [Chromobacterium subtsugae]|uniref:hypothetical protein n=1 Tax=Chromobacterium subtsugae TaxID=251747 RepID=UPI0007F91CB4|nr:hypothetical protein [Chromobacterium subtsugae]OBU85396.1 hypothetical protein MY55_16385 [Chromobacterium subtsugae]